ncbi:hypothetical protein CALCODRAFT_533889 [Calocera cornea HHB12733]|uniref:Uncharacterized protein n=1 Tax=Calocera cornea HHB12733 TaxID=1353952 RepID=A0A165I729_9BASI|nr:hypothetical protein CALCODRAFT_533889 [Calocera cornea HHB12733]
MLRISDFRGESRRLCGEVERDENLEQIQAMIWSTKAWLIDHAQIDVRVLIRTIGGSANISSRRSVTLLVMPKKKGGGRVSSPWSVWEFSPREKWGIDPIADLPAHGRVSPEGAKDDLVRGEVNVVNDRSTVDQRSHPTSLALRLWKSSVTTILTAPVIAASSAVPLGQRYHPDSDLARRLRSSPDTTTVSTPASPASSAVLVGQRYHPTNADRLRIGPDTTTVSTPASPASSAVLVGQRYHPTNADRLRIGPDTTTVSTPASPASSAVLVGQRYHPTDSDFASRLRSSPDTTTVSTPASPASSAVLVGQRYHPTNADRLRIGPDTTPVSTPTSATASSADADPSHASTPSMSITHSAPTAAAVAQSAAIDDPPVGPAPASSRDAVVENDNNIVIDVFEPERANGDASNPSEEPDFDPPAYDQYDTPQGAEAYESRVSTPVLVTVRLEDDSGSDNDQPLPLYCRYPKVLLPPLYSPPRKRRAPAAAPADAVSTEAVPAATVPAPPQRSIAEMSFEELQAVIKANARLKFNADLVKYHIPPLPPINSSDILAGTSGVVVGPA